MTSMMLPKITRKPEIYGITRDQGWVMIRGQHELNNSQVSYATCSSLKGRVLTKNFDK